MLGNCCQIKALKELFQLRYSEPGATSETVRRLEAVGPETLGRDVIPRTGRAEGAHGMGYRNHTGKQ
jgi:hypothetical protein